MKRILIVVAVLALAGGAAAFVQRQDVTGIVDGFVTLPPEHRANSAATGTWVDITNYSGAMLTVTTGNLEQSGTVYVVLQDSSAGLAVALVDSIALAGTADSVYRELNYRGSRRFLRAVQRASGAAADTLRTAATIITTGARSR